ncbi:hypothetical protein XENTR_v10023454 [Xenopus tropicalis]|uniref:Uncharacterized protein LOC101733530 n=1 Tax=Xenopus tropicalis TaxID=8364 RepID=A0A8J0R7V7_XENTR|nr:uncharacterized protein LOC101733530 [Xenopus tropicalis]KAE8578313.1 hypothetical protein XENTR_v10023454 [Xenopus tropicalis]
MNKMETGEIYLQLGNFLPLDEPVTWQTGFEDMLSKVLVSEGQDRSNDFIVPIFVYSTTTGISETDITEMISSARELTGVDPTVVLTHELCVSTNELTQIRDTFRKMGARNIYPVENYTQEDSLKTRGKHKAILLCLYESLKDVEFRMQQELNPVQERIKMKNFLITFAHGRALEKQKLEFEDNRFKEQQERDRAKAANKPWYYFWAS